MLFFSNLAPVMKPHGYYICSILYYQPQISSNNQTSQRKKDYNHQVRFMEVPVVSSLRVLPLRRGLLLSFVVYSLQLGKFRIEYVWSSDSWSRKSFSKSPLYHAFSTRFDLISFLHPDENHFKVFHLQLATKNKIRIYSTPKPSE